MSQLENKTILILTAQFGAGHISAANAIKDCILNEHKNWNVIIKNFIDASIPIMNKPMVRFYENNTKYTPGLYNYYYYLKKSFNPTKDVANKLYTPKFIDYILKINPDLIICTFPSAAACVYNFKLKYPNIKIPSITVITDVVDSMEWVYPYTDMYFVPSSEIKNRFVLKGIPLESIKVTGVPINSKFSCYEKNNSSQKHRLLLLGGGRGLFDFNEDFLYWLDDFIENCKDKLEVTIVTGKNDKLYNNLTTKKCVKNINVLGYVNDMNNLVKNYDLMVTKPGGATLFEAIHSLTPVIVKLPKIGQEIENSKFITDKGIGIIYNDENDLKYIIKNLGNGNLESLIEFMKLNILEFKKSIHMDKISTYISEIIK